MNIGDFTMSREELERLMPVFEKYDPNRAKGIQFEVADASPEARIPMSFLLGVEINKLPPEQLGRAFDRLPSGLLQTPDLNALGVQFYESVKHQVRDAICGKDGIYRKERRKIESSAEPAKKPPKKRPRRLKLCCRQCPLEGHARYARFLGWQ
jgi:hypothetical protein